jgi:hypothetical protein
MSKVNNDKLTDIHIDGLNSWDGEKVISIYPNGLSIQTFSVRAEQDHNSTEFWCAMEKLDDIGVSRIDPSNGKTYSIVGRIAWLTRNKTIEIPKHD